MNVVFTAYVSEYPKSAQENFQNIKFAFGIVDFFFFFLPNDYFSLKINEIDLRRKALL